MKEFLAKKSLIFHLIMLSKGVNFFPSQNRIKPEHGSVGNPVIQKSKKILIVGMSESPHLHTWIQGIAESEVVSELYLFPSDFPIRKFRNPGIKVKEFPHFAFSKYTNATFRLLDLLTNRMWRSYFLYREIKRVRPTHLHFHETQHGAYLYSAIAFHPKNKFQGKVILSTWGSDLMAYGKVDSHSLRLRQVMSWIDLLTSERIDDLQVAKANGFQGTFLSPVYITVGNKNREYNTRKTSERSIVLVKGYQDNHGRALNALASIELLSYQYDLSRFNFKIFSAADSVELQSEILKHDTKLNIEVLPRMPKADLMEYFKEARVYLGLAISDGLSTSMVEAMIYGAFPIQSQNSSAPEFLTNGVSGGVVDPWNIQEVANLLKIALTNDELVDQAAISNSQKIVDKYNWDIGLSKLAEVYE
jgi:glycosyltransferase involved in cell wall biosynthesis